MNRWELRICQPRDAKTCQQHQKPAERQGTGSPLEPSERMRPWQHCGFKLLASRIERIHFCCFRQHSSVVLSYSSPRKLTGSGRAQQGPPSLSKKEGGRRSGKTSLKKRSWSLRSEGRVGSEQITERGWVKCVSRHGPAWCKGCGSEVSDAFQLEGGGVSMTPRDSRVILGKEAGRQGKMAKAWRAEEKPLPAYAHGRAGDRYHGQLSLPVSSNTLEYI